MCSQEPFPVKKCGGTEDVPSTPCVLHMMEYVLMSRCASSISNNQSVDADCYIVSCTRRENQQGGCVTKCVKGDIM